MHRIRLSGRLRLSTRGVRRLSTEGRSTFFLVFCRVSDRPIVLPSLQPALLCLLIRSVQRKGSKASHYTPETRPCRLQTLIFHTLLLLPLFCNFYEITWIYSNRFTDNTTLHPFILYSQDLNSPESRPSPFKPLMPRVVSFGRSSRRNDAFANHPANQISPFNLNKLIPLDTDLAGSLV